MRDTITVPTPGRIAAAIAAAMLLAMPVEASRANPLHLSSQMGVRVDERAMLSFRIPLDAPKQSASSPRVTFDYGFSWRDGPGQALDGGARFTPSMSAGMTLDGHPILSLGSLDIAKTFSGRMNADQETGTSNGRSALFSLAGIAAIGLLVWAINASVDTYEALDEIIEEDPP